MHVRVSLLALLLLCICVVLADVDATCSANKRCENGCCNTSGNCGFGPDYCGSTCRSDCDRKAECKPTDSKWASKWFESEKCPLNVCCSKHGYCGTTKDFCGTKTVSRPTCDKDNGIRRVVGYFEGWAKARPCEAFWPEQIPIGLYTHINFAFATIDPQTSKVKVDDDSDVNIYKRITALKEKDPDLKVYIAIGGWTFNDPGETHTTFSKIAASLPRQKAFIDSLLSFMDDHDFDGLDLDWEYPKDKDRGGHDVDFANFPKFMARLKDALDAEDKGLTITLPASYWYLQNFDIKKLEESVEFFNIMSYDLHGAWDQHVNWTTPVLNAHTNLTEIELALDLLWRNKINSNKVVLGLGFYGRSFTVRSASCTKPGCLFKNPGKEGDCSREAGILLNSEIETVINKNNLKPELNEEAAVKIAKWGYQWVSFDDEETLKMKIERAQQRCLGGVMVWAISHDTKDAKYNKALAKVLDRRVTSGSLDDNEKAETIEKEPYRQCRWTNCKESCPKGWIHVTRSDKHARTKKDERMTDETGCGGDGFHSFCCPPGDLPTCGWWGHRNGKCGKGDCPSDMVEIGSNSMYCNRKHNYQSACCTTDVDSMKVYSTCEWGAYPDCDSQNDCPSRDGDQKMTQLMAFSASGSGGGQCDARKNDLGLLIPGVQFRKFCCNQSNKNLKLHSCDRFRDQGPSRDPEPRGFCRSGCPADYIRVAIDTEIDTCAIAGIGGMAFCCKTTYDYEYTVENEKLDAYRSIMKEWVDEPTCPNPSSVFSRRTYMLDRVVANSSLSAELITRDNVKVEDITIRVLLIYLITGVGSKEMLDQMARIWDSAVEDIFPYLTISRLKLFFTGAAPLVNQQQRDGPEETVDLILCNPSSYNARIAAIQGTNGGGTSKWINCTNAICDKKGVCVDDGEDNVARRSRDLKHLWSRHLFTHHHHLLHPRQEQEEAYEVYDGNDDSVNIEFVIPAHDRVKDFPPDHPSLRHIAEYFVSEDCGDPQLRMGVEWDEYDEDYETEHPVDKSQMKKFILGALKGELESGARARYGPVPIGFYEFLMRLADDDENLAWPIIPGNPAYTDNNLFSRIFECLGSRINSLSFVVTAREINAVKGRLMQLNNPIRKNKWADKVENEIKEVLAKLRATLTVIEYMNTKDEDGPNVYNKVTKVLNDVVHQITFAENLWERENPGQRVNFAQFMIEWFQDYYKEVTAKAKTFFEEIALVVREHWESQTGGEARQVLETVRRLERQMQFLHIETDWVIQDFLMDDDPMDQDTDPDTSMEG